MSSQQEIEKTVMEEVIETLITRMGILEKELLAKNEALLAKENQTQALLMDFEKKFSSISLNVPKPDMSGIAAQLNNGLTGVKEILEKWPITFKKEYRITLFPEQLRSVEYVKAVLTRVVLCIIGMFFLIFTYMLLDKHI